MIRISNIKLGLEERGQVLPSVLKKLKVGRNAVNAVHIFKEAIDARQKGSIQFVYTVDVDIDNEELLLKSSTAGDIGKTPELDYTLPKPGSSPLTHRPVIIGTGPAGLFAGLLLAEMGYKPLLLERGDDVDKRAVAVNDFWNTGKLIPRSNVQFGEGGAGTFSDGKLTTNIKDSRCRKVLQDLVRSGAPADILYSYKPHVGTDILRDVVKKVRQTIVAMGGEVRFSAHVTDIRVERGAIAGVVINDQEALPASVVILAPGHSARDTFQMLLKKGAAIVPKPFSIGARIEHPQSMIDEAQYGKLAGHPNLGAADYKLSHHSVAGRSAYTFCMCPGGLVVAAASEAGGVVTNGMSEHARNRPNANSALLVAVSPEDFGDNHPLAGVKFQRHWEERAFKIAGGSYRAPAQTVGDFLRGKASMKWGGVKPSYLPRVEPADLAQCLPDYVVSTMQEAIQVFDRRLKGFGYADAVLTGVETRSSSPIRIMRRDDCEANIVGLYPAGEGAGYAGGIVSAAVDGLRVAECIIAKYRPN